MTKPYEPRGKIVPFIEAVKADPSRVWTIAEIARVMGLKSNKVGGSLLYAMRAGLLFRGDRQGLMVVSGVPFRENARPIPEPRLRIDRIKMQDTWVTNMEDVRVPKVVAGWVPPQMVAPRG